MATLRITPPKALSLRVSARGKGLQLGGASRPVTVLRVTTGLKGPPGTQGVAQISADAGNALQVGSDERLFVPAVAGPAGPAGAQGPAGPIGPTGAPGVPGADGLVGPAGPAGPAGAQGPAGPIGPAGTAGAPGAPGADGLVGPAGPAGATGAVGPQGPTGPIGPAGADGAIGPAGPAGAVGPAGAQGPAAPTQPDGIAALSTTGSVLTRVDYPDGSYLLLTWVSGVLTSTALHRGGTVKTTTLNWVGGALQSVTTVTTP